MAFLTSFCCDIRIAQLFDRPFDFDIIMKKSVNVCDVRPLVIRQLQTIKKKHASNRLYKLSEPTKAMYMDHFVLHLSIYQFSSHTFLVVTLKFFTVNVYAGDIHVCVL